MLAVLSAKMCAPQSSRSSSGSASAPARDQVVVPCCCRRGAAPCRRKRRAVANRQQARTTRESPGRAGYRGGGPCDQANFVGRGCAVDHPRRSPRRVRSSRLEPLYAVRVPADRGGLQTAAHTQTRHGRTETPVPTDPYQCVASGMDHCGRNPDYTFTAVRRSAATNGFEAAPAWL